VKIKIRYGALQDADGLEGMDRIAHKERKSWAIRSAREYREIIKDSEKRVIIAELDGRLIGYLHSMVKNNREIIWLEDIYVIKSYRKRGVAKKLVKKFVGMQRGKFRGIALLTPDRNVRIFERLGFKKSMNYMSMIFYRHK